MTPTASRVRAELDVQPRTREILIEALSGRWDDGEELVRDCFDPLIAGVYEKLAIDLRPEALKKEQAHLVIAQLSVFARYNSQFLYQAARSTEGACFEFAHELRRNHLEEGGERGKLPAHYVLYSTALREDLGIIVNGEVPTSETQTLLVLHDLLVASHSLGRICGGYYATEGVAIAETRLLQEVTNRYGSLTIGRAGTDLANLAYYYDLHLDEEHPEAHGGISVEASHSDGIARFIRQSGTFGVDLADAADGFLQILEGMAYWWGCLIARSAEL